MTTCETTKQIRVHYSASVAKCTRRLLVLPPARRGSQVTLEERWHCSPEPDESKEIHDEFGNRFLEIKHAKIESDFVFNLWLRTEREGSNSLREENLPSTGIGAFLVASALCDLGGPIEQVARDEFGKGRNEKASKSAAATLGLATRICDWTYAALRYTPGSTTTGTTASHVLASGEGVCQDYAHLMIALCRACAIPARYISGYNPAEGGMHAWVETLCGEIWHAFDPTHARLTRPDCVYVATGRDFRDVSPVSGKFSGNAKANLESLSRTRVIET